MTSTPTARGSRDQQMPASDLRTGMRVRFPDGTLRRVTSTDADHRSVSIEYDHRADQITSLPLDWPMQVAQVPQNSPEGAESTAIACPRCASTDVTFDFEVTVSLRFVDEQFTHVVRAAVTDHLPDHVFCDTCAEYAPTDDETARLWPILHAAIDALPSGLRSALADERAIGVIEADAGVVL